MTKRMIIMLVAVGVVLGGIFGFKAFVDNIIADVFDNMEQEPAAITVAEVTEERWNLETTAVGTFRAVNGAELTTEAGGIVTQIHFNNGDEVEKGQLLVSLDIETDEAELESLESAEQLASMELTRYRRLYEEGNSSQSELQRRESEAAQATASVKAQQARIRQKTIRAPFDGISGIRQVNIGQYVSPGSPVVAVQSLDPIYQDFTLPERQFASIRSGLSLAARVDSYPTRSFDGEITAIEPSVSESTRTFRAQATLENPDQELRPGMFGRVRMDLGDPRDVMVIPQSAVQFDPYGNSVYVIVEDDDEELRAQRRFIRTGERRGDLVAVVDGLEKGDRVATSGLLKLRNNARVKINDDESVQPTADADPRPENQ